MATTSYNPDTDKYLEPAVLESTYYIRDSFRIKEFVFQRIHLLSTPYYFIFETENIIWTLQCVNTKNDRRECTMILKLQIKGNKVEDLIKGGISINCGIVKEDGQKKISVTPIIHEFLDDKPTSQHIYKEAYVEENTGVRSATVLVQIYFIDVLVRRDVKNMTNEVTNVYNAIVFLCRQKIFTSDTFSQQKAIKFLHKNYHKIANCDDFEQHMRSYVCLMYGDNFEAVDNDSSFAVIWTKAMEIEAAKEEGNAEIIPPPVCKLS